MNIKKRSAVVILLLICWLVIHLAYTVIDGLSNTKNRADLAVILGSKVNTDGTLSERLTQRLTCALHLYKSGQVKHLLVSGGLGKEGFYEGDKMKEFLLRQGVPDSTITVDNKGDNTIKTVKNTLALQNKLHFKNLIVVSQYFHLTRTKMLFRKDGFSNLGSASPGYFEWRDLYSLLREFVAYYKELF